MAVYVDDVRFPYRGMIMCHLFADSDAELHAMADRIGIQRRWFQKPPRASWRHYDISLTKKREALRAGAIQTDRWGALEHVARLNGDQKMLERIAARRAVRAGR